MAARPVFPMRVNGYSVDQLALHVKSVSESVAAYVRQGFTKWVIDQVTAKDHLSGAEFQVLLAFNYQLLPGGVEMELLELVNGESAQIKHLPPGLSHLGFHVDDMDWAISRFKHEGHNLLADVTTTNHTGCPHRYRYSYLDTRELGFIAKLIRRVD